MPAPMPRNGSRNRSRNTGETWGTRRDEISAAWGRLVQRGFQRFEGALLIGFGVSAGKHWSYGVNVTTRGIVVSTAICDFGQRQRDVCSPIGIAGELCYGCSIDLLQERGR